MKKYVAAVLLILASLPTYAFASSDVADSSTTTTFTVEIVEESLGLVVSGSTNLGKVSRSQSSELIFPDLSFSNQGEVKGYLYAEVGDLSGISFGSSEGDLTEIVIASGSGDIESLDQYEKLLSGVMRELDEDGDLDGINPGETLQDFDLIIRVKDRFPVGKLSVPVRWTLKAS